MNSYQNIKIYLAGHNGMVGNALIKHLNILKITAKDLYLMTIDVETKSLSFK